MSAGLWYGGSPTGSKWAHQTVIWQCVAEILRILVGTRLAILRWPETPNLRKPDDLRFGGSTSRRDRPLTQSSIKLRIFLKEADRWSRKSAHVKFDGHFGENDYCR